MLTAFEYWYFSKVYVCQIFNFQNLQKVMFANLNVFQDSWFSKFSIAKLSGLKYANYFLTNLILKTYGSVVLQIFLCRGSSFNVSIRNYHWCQSVNTLVVGQQKLLQTTTSTYLTNLLSIYTSFCCELFIFSLLRKFVWIFFFFFVTFFYSFIELFAIE